MLPPPLYPSTARRRWPLLRTRAEIAPTAVVSEMGENRTAIPPYDYDHLRWWQ